MTDAPPPISGTGDFEIGLALREGFDCMKRSVGVWLVGGLLYSLAAVLSAITIVGYFVIVPVLFWGMLKLLFNVYDGGGEPKDVFSGFQRFGQALAGMLIIFLVNLAISIPGSILQVIGAQVESAALSIAGGLVAVVLACVVAIRWYFAPFYVVDHGLPGIDALKASWAATQGLWLKVFLFTLASALILTAGYILCFVGVFPAAAVLGFAWVSAFRQMAGGPSTGSSSSSAY